MRISYSIQNIRRLAYINPIEIRPITVLVGRNSAGKSTFLRSLPLIRQSIETRTSAPILWFGDYVDFGDFKTAVSDESSDKNAIFSFRIDALEGRDRLPVSPMVNYMLRYRNNKIVSTGIEIDYFIGYESGNTVLKRIKLSVPNEDLDCDISYRGRAGTGGSVLVNGRSVEAISSNYEIINSSSNFFSLPTLATKNKDSASNARRRNSYQEALVIELEKLVRRDVSRISSNDTFRIEVANIFTGNLPIEKKFELLKREAGTQSFRKYYNALAKRDHPSFVEFITIQKTYRALQLLDAISDNLSSFFQGISYLGPARAAGERYYRKQELEVSEILPNGSNFPMFLDSLSNNQKKDFSSWVEKQFGYGVELKSFEGHISINLRAGNKSVNVTDTGYGVSQILPVLASVWWSTQRPPDRWLRPNLPRRNERTIAIEQPELHLHPAHQAKLADVFSKGVALGRRDSSPNRVNIICETHSEALINRLGELIELGLLNNDDVQIVIFSAPDDINSPTEVSLAKFDKNGALDNWPFGFFNYSR